ncbi:SHOCT domain-containing protein [Kineosporia babensis]|uniref:SHOCT domain-containing protein n=1 Tax=Kineosporia babensis TaxID=499548 RepID=A0A9X1SXI4_9ACTN|nr:SHOCT domain-containing protein [Kineosporia babensis]MCD5315926.1 SHOCT domain-containing protein [Kineosporia babensis]
MDTGWLTWLRRAPVSDQLRAAQMREDLVEAADRAAFGRPCEGELATLATLLSENEVVQQLIEGRRGKQAGLLALTTRRVLFTAEGTGPQQALVIDRAEVRAASGQVHRGLGTLTLTTSAGELVVDQILGTQAETFAENTLRSPDTAPPTDPLAELALLKARHQAGTIGDAEFEARKRQLFDAI